MFFKCFLELSAALSKNSYQGKVLQKQLKVFSQTSYLRPAQWKAKGRSYKHSHSGLCARLTQKQHLHVNGFIRIQPHKLGMGGESTYKPHPAHTFLHPYGSPTLTLSHSAGHSRGQHISKASVTNEDWSYSKVSGLLEDKGKTATEVSNLFQTILPPPQHKLRIPKHPKNKENETEIIWF